MKEKNIKTVFKIFNLSLSAILIAVAVFLAYVAVPYFGNKALIVRSGSMQPAIGVGDLVVVRAQKSAASPAPNLLPKYKAGDIVAFYGERDSKVLTTHRIVGVQPEGGEILYQTKGDANKSADENLVSQQRIVGKTSFTIPGMGKVFALAKTKNGFLALVIVPAILVIIFELFSIFREITKIRRRKSSPQNLPETGPRGPSNVLVRVLIPLIVCMMFSQESFASYADTETSGGNSLQAAESFSQSSPQTSQEALTSPSPVPSPSPTPEISP